MQRALCGVALLSILLVAAPAGASTTSSIPTSATQVPTETRATTPATQPDGAPVTAPHIIPQPNSGVAPQHAGDRGSGTQYLVLSGIVAALVACLLLVRRESRRKRSPRPRDSVD